MLVARDENKTSSSFSLSSLSNSSSFISTALSLHELWAGQILALLAVKQAQQIGSMAEFSAFRSRDKHSNLLDESSCPMPSRQANVSRPFKMKQGLELLITHLFYFSIVQVIWNGRKQLSKS